MFKPSTRAFVLSLILISIAGNAFCQDTVKLEYKFKPNDLLRYKVIFNTTDRSGGKAFISDGYEVDGILRIRIIKIQPSGDAEIRLAFESGTVLVNGKTKTISPDNPLPLTCIMTKNGVLKGFESHVADGTVKVYTGTKQTPSGDGGHMTESTSMSINVYESALGILYQSFPQTALKVGDTWTYQSLMDGQGNTANAQCKLQNIGTKPGNNTPVIIKQTVDKKSTGSMYSSSAIIEFDSITGRMVSNNQSGSIYVGTTGGVLADFSFTNEISLLPPK